MQPAGKCKIVGCGTIARLTALGHDYRELSTTTVPSRQISTAKSYLADLFKAKLAIVLSDNLVALASGVFKFLAVHDLHCTTGVVDELLPLQNTSSQAHGRSICP